MSTSGRANVTSGDGPRCDIPSAENRLRSPEVSVLGASGGCPRCPSPFLMNAIALNEPAEMARLYRTTQQLPAHGPWGTVPQPKHWWAPRASRAPECPPSPSPSAALFR